VRLQSKGEVAGVNLTFMYHKFLVLTVNMVKIGVHLRKLSHN